MKCRLCEAEAPSADFQVFLCRCRFNGAVLVRYQCPACDVVFGPEYMIDLSPAVLVQEYTELYRNYSEADTTDGEIGLFQILHPLTSLQGGKYLDYGSGKNQTVEVLQGRGFDVVGYDPAISGKDLLGQPFDGIFSNNVIEHLQDPVGAFREMVAMLKPGGVMAHRTPCYAYHTPDTRFHLFFFLGRSVDVLCARTGLRVRERSDDWAVFERCGG